MTTEDERARIKAMEEDAAEYEARLKARMAVDGVTAELEHTGHWEDVDRVFALRLDYGRSRGIECPVTHYALIEGCYGPFGTMAGRRLYFEAWAQTKCPHLGLKWVDPPSPFT